MKKVWMIICIVVLFAKVHGQSVIRSILIEVSNNQTTNLIFPSDIVSVDRGSERIVVQKSISNILRVKADTLFSDTTNLTVVTAGGKLYSFLVRFSNYPSILTLNLGVSERIDQDTAMLHFARRVIHLNNRMHGVRYSIGNVSLSLHGVYTNGEIIAVKMRMENHSPFSYEVGRIAARLGTMRTARRKAEQERELPLLLTEMETSLVRGKQISIIVVLVPKSAFTPTHTLQIQLHERAGERHLSLTVPNHLLLKAYLLK
ncbi:DUF4138 domain-containing protein [Sediminibacterium sp.]|jgi:conjugative transposon TraN protein|uniref:DUF4138 domain-containing protein n=1 Tax=Sediminibacterium sp. TaxID=1917865 RepID=UPI003F70DFF5